MKPRAAGLILGIAAVVFLAVPAPTHASSKATFFGPIVPKECHCDKQKVVDGSGEITTAPDYGCALQVIQNLINFGITLATLIFTLYLVLTGISFITSSGSSEARSKAKARFMNVFIGLAVLLCAWLIVDFVMKTLYNEGSFGPWNAIIASDTSDASRCIVARQSKAISAGSIATGLIGTASNVTPGTASGGGSGTVSAGKLSDADARAKLKAAGVNIAQGFAAAKSLANTREDTINQITNIKSACGCTVQVNATTGGTHKATAGESHGNGFKVDLQPNGKLDSFLGGLTRNGSRSDGTALYYDKCGNQYAREKTHWDITVNKGSCTLGH